MGHRFCKDNWGLNREQAAVKFTKLGRIASDGQEKWAISTKRFKDFDKEPDEVRANKFMWVPVHAEQELKEGQGKWVSYFTRKSSASSKTLH